MRPIIRSLAIALLLVVAGPLAAQATLKFAYIDSRIVLSQAPGRAEAEAQFDRDLVTYRQQIKRMGDSLNAMLDDYKKQETTLSPPAKDARQKLIQQKEQEYQERTQRLEAQASDRQAELVKPIMDQINKVLEEMRNDAGYTMIFDVGATSQVVVAADKNLDITDKVVAKLKTLPIPKAVTVAPKTPDKAGAPTGAPAGVTRPKIPPSR